MSGYLRHIRALNNHNPEAFVPFWIEGQLVGRVRPKIRERLLREHQLFVAQGPGVTLHPRLADFETRTQALAEFLPHLLDELGFEKPLGEPYPVTACGPADALMTLDRAAAPIFGLRTFGQHINGLVQDGDRLYMWLGRRSADRIHHPGRLDQLVAGGLPLGIGLEDNLRKEAAEEAGIAPQLVQKARPVAAISYNQDTKKGYKYDVLYCYDLFLPQDFTPRCQDGEVESFSLLPIAEVMEKVSQTQEFKPNCNLVVLDFLLRHGYLGPKHQEYLEICTGLHPPMIPINPD